MGTGCALATGGCQLGSQGRSRTGVGSWDRVQQPWKLGRQAPTRGGGAEAACSGTGENRLCPSEAGNLRQAPTEVRSVRPGPLVHPGVPRHLGLSQ